MSKQKEQAPPSVIKMALDNMPRGVKAVMFGLLAVPISLALSAMIMGVNVGSIIEKWIDLKVEERKIELEHMDKGGYSSLEVEQMHGWVCSHKAETKPGFCR